MKIGITYDLRQDYLDMGYGLEETAEFDQPSTIDAIENTLAELGHDTERVGNYQSLMSALHKGQRWDLVFNVAEGMYGLGRESLVPCLLDAYSIPYTFSDPMVSAITLHKGMCKRVIRDLGIPTADFEVINDLEDLETLNLEYPLFVKPVAEGTAKGITSKSKIETREALLEVTASLLETYRQPVLVERFLPGRELTVGIVGTGREARVVGVLDVKVKTEDEIYSYETKEKCEEMVDYILVRDEKKITDEASRVALDAWRGVGCRDGGRVDVKLDENEKLMFLEINPLAGLHPSHSDLPIMCTQAGISYRDLIQWIIDSAASR